MHIRVLAFARLRELLMQAERRLELPDGARVCDAWNALVQRYPALEEQSRWTRFARNGRLAAADDPLAEDDELALLPPVGGG
jgi:molybdopterin converting factor small subunit